MSRIVELDTGLKSIENNPPAPTALVDLNYDSRETKEDFFTSQGIELPSHLLQAIAKRRLDYLAGRHCAKLALNQLGFSQPVSIPSGSNRAPQWPAGFLGAITHTKGYAAAIVGLKSHWLGLGLDAEIIVDESKPPLVRHVCRPGEFENLKMKGNFPDQFLFTLIFSAKESLFKALYPAVQTYFGFQSAQLQEIDQDAGGFVIELAHEIHEDLPAWKPFRGSFIILKDKIITLIKVPTDFPEPNMGSEGHTKNH